MENNFKKLSSVSFFCPAYNDEKNLPLLVPEVYNLLREITDKFEIIIVHDGSSDRTGDIADELTQKYPNVRVVHHYNNLGYGATLRDGFLAARYDYVMYTDGDNQYDVREFMPYLHLLETADVISGYVTEKAVSWTRKLQSFVYNFIIQILFLVDFKDINCSMKIYKRRVIDKIKIASNSAFIDAEMIIKAKRNGFKISQFPVTHYRRMGGIASGSKPFVILSTFTDIIKFRFNIL